MLKAVPTSVLLMAAVGGAATRAALALHEASLACVFDMEVGKGVKLEIAQRVLMVSPACAYPMVVVAGASTPPVQKVLRVALCSVKHMVEVKGVRF